LIVVVFDNAVFVIMITGIERKELSVFIESVAHMVGDHYNVRIWGSWKSYCLITNCTIKHDPDITIMTCFDEGFQIVRCAKAVVDSVNVLGPVSMIALGRI
jgi:hypothetical protein